MPTSPRILVFGEADSDREAIKQLIEAACPLAVGRVQKLAKPLLLVRGAQVDLVRHRAIRLATTIRANERLNGPVACVFVHEDADDVAPADERIAERMVSVARTAGVDICPVVPAWEIESWWLLFPDAVARAFPHWRKLRDQGTARVDTVSNAKERLANAVRPPHGRRGYVESDGVRIAAAIRDLGLVRSPRGRSTSYERLLECIDTCCARLAAHPRSPRAARA